MSSAPRIVILNPNTSQMVSDLLLRRARAITGTAAQIEVYTAPFGSDALRNAEDLLVAEQAVAAMATGIGPCCGIIIGAFGDPGLSMLRAGMTCPVAGLGESSYLAAAALGCFAILTMGTGMESEIWRRASGLGVADRLAECHFLTEDIPDVAARPESFMGKITEIAAAAASRGARSLLLGGAPFSGMASVLPNGFPVFDGLNTALAEILCRTGEKGQSGIGDTERV